MAWLTVAIGCAASLLVGCSSPTAPSEATSSSEDSTTGASDDGSTPGSPNTSNASDDPPPPSTSTTEAEGGSSTSDGRDTAFVEDPDGGPPNPIECTTWEEDCARGEKCAPWANDGGTAWNALRCVPIDAVPDPIGEPCTVEGSTASGIDSCALGSMCWNVDAKTQTGTCVPHCAGTPQDPECPPYQSCFIGTDGVLVLCLPECLPIDPAPCPDGDGCYPSEDNFGCSPDMSSDGGGAFTPCESPNECAPGSTCVDPTTVDACDDAAAGCCTPFCDLEGPSCPEGTSCMPYFDVAPLGYEGLGVCE